MVFLEFVVAFFAGLDPITQQFLIGLCLSLFLGYLMGAERELRGKDAGISTHIFVMGGSMLFTLLSMVVDSESKSRIAAQIVSGIGFLGAGLILKEGATVRNLTTAASIWFSSAIGMSIGFGYYAIAVVSGVIGVFIPRIPHLSSRPYDDHHECTQFVQAVSTVKEAENELKVATKKIKRVTNKKAKVVTAIKAKSPKSKPKKETKIAKKSA
jgi:putative Mg2+ transporter-C (MgtC) family protein